MKKINVLPRRDLRSTVRARCASQLPRVVAKIEEKNAVFVIPRSVWRHCGARIESFSAFPPGRRF